MSKPSERLAEIERKILSLEDLRSELGDDVVEPQLAKLRAEREALSGGDAAKVVVGDEVHGDKVRGDKITAPLVQVIHNYASLHPGVDADDLQHQIAEYLDWVQESFGTLVLRGIEQGGRQAVTLPLENVYVPLRAEYLDEMAEADEPEVAMRRLEKPRRAGAEMAHGDIALNQVLALGKRIIITGGPGCGKTTVLQHMAWALAHALREGGAGVAKEKLGLDEPLPLPVYAPLSLYAAYLRNLPPNASGGQKRLATFISDYLLQRQTHLALSPDFLAYLLREGKDVLLLLDGLDEVPDEAQRVRIRQAIDDLCAGRGALRTLVTSRTAAYRGQAVLGRGFRQVQALPLQAPQIEALVRQAYRSIYPRSPAQAQTIGDDLLESIRQLEGERRQRLGEGTPALVNSPLMVRLLLIVHFNERRLPDQRADLYRRAVDAMLSPEYVLDQEVQREIERRMGGSLATNREMLQYLAFHMHQRGDQQGREIDEDALRQVLQAEPTYIPYIADLIEQTCQRGTLLEERGGSYRFIHLSFQEFLAGRYLAEAVRDVERMAAFLENGPVLESWWREPALLLAGYLDITAPALARRLLLRLAGLDEAAGQRKLPLEVQLAAAELAAAAYLECKSQAEDLNELLRQRLLALLHDTHKPYAAPLRRAAAADMLDRLGWLPTDLYQFVQVGSFWMGKYPLTHIQYQRFLEAEDFADPQLWKGFPRFDECSQAMEDDWGERGWQWLREILKDKRRSPDGRRVLPYYWNDPRFGIGRKGAPVVGVVWYEANAYCRWLQRHWEQLEEGRSNPGFYPALIRLPTEAEWELAAGGIEPEGRYAWDAPGETTPDEAEILRRANIGEKIGRTTPVGMYPLGSSQPYGLCDLSGNVWEWQANYYSGDHGSLALRGGSWYSNTGSARCAARLGLIPGNHDLNGFRVVASLACSGC